MDGATQTLGGGANTLILTMTDAAGNVSVTNLSVIQSEVLLVLDDLLGVDLNQPTISVTGTINVDDHTVWVNGVKATMTGQNGAGLQTWSAENVPMNDGGTAVIQSTAIPNTDNGGNGTGGSGGSGATMQNPGNPSSPDNKTVEGSPDKPAEIVVTHYHMNRTFNATQLSVSQLTVQDTENIKWDLNKSGYWNSDGCWGGNGDFYFAWTDRDWDASGVGTQTGIYVVRGPDVCGVKIPEYSGSYQAPSGWPGESCEGGDGRLVKMPFDDPWIQVVKRDTRTLYELRTGGKKAIKGRKNLFVLTGSAVGHADMFYPEIDYWPETYTIANDTISLGKLGKLGSDGVLYMALGDGETHDVTPTVAGSRYYRYGQPGQTKFTPKIFANEHDLDEDTPEFCVGQNITFELRGLPSYVDQVSHWNLPDKYVNEPYQYSSVCTSYRRNEALLLNTFSTSCWFVNGQGGNASIGTSLRFSNGQMASIAAMGRFSVYRPTFVGFNCWMHVFSYATPVLTGDMRWDVTVNSKHAGSAGITQLIKGSAPFYSTGGQWYQDGDTELYRSQAYDPANPASHTVQFDDNPSAWTFGYLHMKASFKDYLRFCPGTAGSIWVTLGKNGWEMDGVDGSSVLPAATPVVDSDEFPIWEGILHE